MQGQEKSLLKPHREKLEGEAYRTLVEQVFKRDGWKCRNPFCGSMKNLTPHHVRKRSQLGGDEPGNLLTLCVVCHDAVERNELKIEVVDLVVKFHG